MEKIIEVGKMKDRIEEHKKQKEIHQVHVEELQAKIEKLENEIKNKGDIKSLQNQLVRITITEGQTKFDNFLNKQEKDGVLAGKIKDIQFIIERIPTSAIKGEIEHIKSKSPDAAKFKKYLEDN